MGFTNLMREQLESADDLEVVVSLVEVPPGVRLPAHTHPGEEFAYVMDGEITLWMEGEGERLVKAGEAGKVPLAKVHTIHTGDVGAKLLVFRVHQLGQPERILVDAAE